MAVCKVEFFELKSIRILSFDLLFDFTLTVCKELLNLCLEMGRAIGFTYLISKKDGSLYELVGLNYLFI